MTTGCGYVAAGGQRSQLMVRDLDSNWFAQTTVGGSINNAMCISKHPKGSMGPRLLICNNDETIKVLIFARELTRKRHIRFQDSRE